MATLDDLRRQALEDGEELVIDGRVFNAERTRARLAPVPKPAAPPKPAPVVSAPPAPLPAPPAVLPFVAPAPTREETAAPAVQTQELVDAISNAFASVQAPQQQERPSRWKMKVKYDGRGRIEDIDMLPLYD
jgi:hypothetical protein